jgi:hypothetical protein
MRVASIVLILLLSAANAASAVLLIRAILDGRAGAAGPLFASGASIWGTNVIVFGLWYWEFDRGGPIRRVAATSPHFDLMFPQMTSPELAPPDWEPHFVDYLYLSFTNATAFSPTDVMPLARWAKLTMLVQSAVSLAVGALVIARAVNILKALLAVPLVMMRVAVGTGLPAGSPEAPRAAAEPGDREDPRHCGYQAEQEEDLEYREEHETATMQEQHGKQHDQEQRQDPRSAAVAVGRAPSPAWRYGRGLRASRASWRWLRKVGEDAVQLTDGLRAKRARDPLIELFVGKPSRGVVLA